MALKPTIYKFDIALADVDRNAYDDLNLTVACHPSETVERMMVRVLAYCANAAEGLEFTRGLSEDDEPDLWRHSLDGRILDWIEVGEPSADRLRKARGLAERVRVYTFNRRSEVWWRQLQGGLDLRNLTVTRFPWESVEQLAGLVQRTTGLSVTIHGPSMYVAGDLGEVEILGTQLTDF